MTYPSKKTIIPSNEYFSEEDVINLKNYKYKGEDAGISTYLLWNPVTLRVLDYTPECLA